MRTNNGEPRTPETASPPGPTLLIGASGMLGRACRTLLDERRLPYHAPPHRELDLADVDSIQRSLDSQRFAVVINCAAWTDVDGAEEHEPEATALNGHAVGELARRCREHGATLVHYSTDYVFDGQATRPYPTDEPRSPLNAYGRSKAVGEVLLEQSGAEHLLIRTSWLYAPWGKNFVRTMARLTQEREALRVVDDQRGRPTSAEHLARASLALLERHACGTFHVTDGGECTWCEFAQAISRQLNDGHSHGCDVQPCTSDEFPRPAKRPAYSVLDLSATEALLGPMPSWQENLAAVLHKLPCHAE